MKSWCLILSLAVATFPAIGEAAQREQVCLKYRKDYSWSKVYEVEATLVDGMELTRATQNYTRFKTYSTYAVIFWAKDQATILEMPALSMNDVPMFYTNVKDMDGNEWRISKKTSVCF